VLHVRGFTCQGKVEVRLGEGGRGSLGHLHRRGRHLVDQALDRGVEQRCTRRFPALGLRPPLHLGGRAHVSHHNTDTSHSTEMFL